MSRSWIWGFVFSILVMVAIVAVTSNDSGQGSDSRLGDFMLPGLRADVPNITRVVVKSNDLVTTLVSADGWTVQEKFEFEADIVKLSELLKSLSGSRLTERKTSKPENFSLLGVDKDSEDATIVEIYAGENTYTVLVGKSVSNRKGQYIRLFQHASEADQVWLADKELDSSADPVDWLRDEVIDIEANRVQKVLFATGEDRLEAVRKDADLELVDLPEDAELSYPTIVETLARALVNVRLQDVIPVEQIDFNAASKATFSLDDDTEINVELV
jgi:hypothetical protein